MRWVATALSTVTVGAGLVSPMGASPVFAAPGEHTVRRILVAAAPGAVLPRRFSLTLDGNPIEGDLSPANGAGVARADMRVPLRPASARRVAAELSARADIGWAVPDRWVTSAAAPNDPGYARQWALGAGYGVHAEAAWPVTVGTGTVAVIDSGYVAHADLAGQFVPGYDMVDCSLLDCSVAADGDGRDPDPTDPGDSYTDTTGTKQPSSWHGTHVNGIIAAVQNNTAGVTGLAPGVVISPVRVLGAGGGWLSDVLDGVTWAVGGQVPGVTTLNEHPARVINMSLETPGACDPATQATLDFVYDMGAVVVVAAGNSGVDAAGTTPAGCRHVLTVGATTATGARAAYSNVGPAVDISAPGGDGTASGGIYSTLNKGQYTATRSPAGDIYSDLSGTSMAAPFVSAAVAMMMASRPEMTTPALYSRVRDSRFASQFAGGACDPVVTCGAGILNVARLLGSEAVWGPVTARADGFDVPVLNPNPDLTYTATADVGTVSVDGAHVVHVTGLLPSQTATVTWAASRGSVVAGTSTVTAAALCGSPEPVIGSVTRGDTGWGARITNFSSAAGWQVSTDAGAAAVSSEGDLAVTGLAGSQAATVTVTATAAGCAPTSRSVSSSALPSVVLTPVSGVMVGRSRIGLRVLWTVPPPQDGRVIGVRVRVSRVNSTRYTAWRVVDGRSFWRTTERRRGRYRVQIAMVYGNRWGPVTTKRVTY